MTGILRAADDPAAAANATASGRAFPACAVRLPDRPLVPESVASINQSVNTITIRLHCIAGMLASRDNKKSGEPDCID
jgi:hypothetical protein